MPHEAAHDFIATEEQTRVQQPARVQAFTGFLPPISNTTYTPNQFFDVCIPNCSRSAIRIVGYFIRRTLGWCDAHGNPQEDQIEISFSELSSRSGVSRDRLRSALDEAIAGHFIECAREGRAKSANDEGQRAVYRLRWDASATYIKRPEDFRGFFEGAGNRTDIPNQFFDHIIPTEPLSVIKVVGSIIRSSIGFEARRGARRQCAALSYTQIQRFTRLLSRKEIASAIRTAIEKNYIARIDAGVFSADKMEQHSATYALRWIDGWSGNLIGQKSLPEKNEAHQSEIPTRNGQIRSPENQSDSPTSIKTKLINETQKQQQAAASPVFELLKQEGFDDKTAAELAGRFSLERVEKQIAWLPHRAPARSRLGMLRRAIEDFWPEPQKVRTSEQRRLTPEAFEFVRHFYSGFHKQEGEPVVEATARECESAVPIIQRLLACDGDAARLTHWGRELGSLAREQRNPIPSFNLALRQFGDRLLADAQRQGVERNRTAVEAARTAHQERFASDYVEFLKRIESDLRASQPEDFARFLAKRASERQRLAAERTSWAASLLTDHDTERAYLRDLQRHFGLPDFWSWDATENPYSFTSQS
ncbi:MAG: hypothetical protein WCN98_06515 [Verrucomicrobiaceae bacterium]